MLGWKKTNVSENLVTISGGLNKTKFTVKSMPIAMGRMTFRFLQLDKNADWFLKGVGGGKCQKGDLKYVNVIEAIRVKFNQGEDFDDDGPAVAAKSAVAEKNDACAATDDDESYDPTEPQMVKSLKHRAKRSLVKSLKMPNKPPCVASDDANDTSTVVVYRNCQKCNFAAFYLRTDGLDWLLSYAADELYFQAVPQTVETAVAGMISANCPEVPDLHLAWDFQTRAWKGEFISGTFVGVTRIFGTADLTAQRLSLMRDAGIGEKAEGKAWDYLIAKHRAKAVITLWCQVIANGTSNTPSIGDFEKKWGLTNKRACDEAAVAESAVAGRRTRSRGVQLSLQAAFSDADPVPKLRRSGAQLCLEGQEQSSQS